LRRESELRRLGNLDAKEYDFFHRTCLVLLVVEQNLPQVPKINKKSLEKRLKLKLHQWLTCFRGLRLFFHCLNSELCSSSSC
jgi:hypothetical protein